MCHIRERLTSSIFCLRAGLSDDFSRISGHWEWRLGTAIFIVTEEPFEN